MIVKKNKAKNITQLITELFKTHGFESEEHDGWVIPNGSDYAMKGYWYPEATENVGQLTIELFVNSEMIMVESFAGIGEGENERLKSAFSSFLHHSFPTFLLAVWGVDSKEVIEESWLVGPERYRVFIGNLGILNYDKEKQLDLPPRYAQKIKEQISSEHLENEFHWFTMFYANMNGLDTHAEILKDNVKWTVGEKVLRSLDWKRSNHYYAIRQFIVLKKI
jgi:hypothetical protein